MFVRCFCLSEHDNGWAENASWRTATGERLPASIEGHDLQWKDKGANRKIYSGNGVDENEKSGT